MKVNKTWTWSFYSRVYRHVNEIALAASYSKTFHFALTFGEWSWSFGVGKENDMALDWYGPYFSYVMSSDPAERGYLTLGISSEIYWEAP